MRLESGPAAYDRNWFLMYLVLCLGLGGYFLYDYAIGYPNKNLNQARRELSKNFGADKVPSEFPETPTKDDYDRIVAGRVTDPERVREILGEPFHTMPAPTGAEHNFFVSAYGMATVPITAEGVDLTHTRWTAWGKSKEEIRIQLWAAIVAFIIAVIVLRRVIKAATLHVVVDDEGMTYARQRIPAENMKRLCDFSPKGWVDLYYQHGAQERRLRIDNQKVRKFDEIIDALCDLKGFDDPRAEPEESAEPAGGSSDAESEPGEARDS
jgi:hypothetical protein